MDERRLQKLFRFTATDLAANRHGRLSPAQQQRLDELARTELKSARDSAIILLVIALGGLTFGLILSWFAPTLLSRIFFITVLCILWTTVWTGQAWRILREAKALSKPYQVRTAQGRVHIIRHTDAYGGVEYILQIGEMEFDLDGNPTGAMLEDEICTVHYLEATQEILTVEGA